MKTLNIKIEEKEENKPDLKIEIKDGKKFTRSETILAKYLFNSIGNIVSEIGTLKNCDENLSKKERND